MKLAKWLSIAIISSCFLAERAGSECGIASIYWEGTQTANGERYHPDGISAAHKTLPFGTRVAVRDVRSGRSVMVRINDRGPFIDGRIIDLSRGAASVLGIIDQGLAQVCTEIVTIGAANKLPPLSQRVRHTTRYEAKTSVKKICKKRRHVVRRKRRRCKKISIPESHKVNHSKYFAQVLSLNARRKAFAQVSEKPKEEKVVFHELLGAAAMMTFVSPLFEAEQAAPPPKLAHHKHELLQKVVDVRFEKKLESLEEKMDRILGKMETAKEATPAKPTAPPAPPPSEPQTQQEPLAPPEPPKRIDAALKQRIDTLAKKIRLESGQPTDSGLPTAPLPENVKPDGQGASSPDKKFWINPEDERRKASEPSPAPKPTPPPPSQADESAPSFSQKMMMKKLAEQLESIDRRLNQLEAKKEATAPAYPKPEYAPLPKPKEQKIPKDVEAKIRQAPESMQPDIRRRYREHMKKPCFFTDEEGEKIPCTMRSLMQ